MASDQRVKVQPAEIIEQRTYQVPGKLLITEHHFLVPKDHHNPSSGTLRLFARSARRAASFANPLPDDNTKPLPWMLWLNGGPGQSCPPPQHYPFTDPLLDRGYQVLILDQRGTGLSTPVTASTLGQRGDVDVQARHLKLYRADSIVRDCEAIRFALAAQLPAGSMQGLEKWSIFGQSFGGFISVTYLSFYPEGLRESFIFGGLMPLVEGPDEVYRRLYRVLRRRNEVYYAKYPEDVERVKSIVKFLGRWGDGRVKLPSGGSLTGRLFLALGIGFGMHRRIDSVHDLVLKAALDIEMFGHLTRGTLSTLEASLGWDDCLIYSILHEPIYTNGTAPRWSAHRVKEEEYPEFSLKRLDSDDPLYFTGEMVYPWMFDDCFELAKVKPVAEKLAADSDWPPLYDLEQLAKNEVPVYAAAYVEDMYVDIDFSRETAAAIKGCKMFSTNVYYHNAIREKCKEVVDQLFALRDDVID
ncbi:alpha/beta hydrolase fold-containing protein 13 [Elsinoe australis]|uniref:Alpha/beta hydrolase fold-containing protein 13 n=1 Tax=Elsinoe australis TaxID=40998 RepID=A0A4U7B8U0_9PEZI|nr:alpha/beta hydrolase fold-containing protein 13 [Elsinoe australis]